MALKMETPAPHPSFKGCIKILKEFAFSGTTERAVGFDPERMIRLCVKHVAVIPLCPIRGKCYIEIKNWFVYFFCTGNQSLTEITSCGKNKILSNERNVPMIERVNL